MLLTLVFPVARAFFRVEVSYNEGWNIYNAQTLVRHELLYPVAYGWRSVNYPMLSFAILAQLHQWTHDYLFTARALSLIGLAGSGMLVGAIVRRLGASWQAAVLAGFFCMGMFATDADAYVGSDDPQMFAQIFFLAGLLLYVWRRVGRGALVGAALLFVVGGSIKHNPIDFPLAVLIDLALIAPRRALWFGGWGIGFAAASVALNIHFGGPYCIVQLMSPRTWLLSKAVGGHGDDDGAAAASICGRDRYGIRGAEGREPSDCDDSTGYVDADGWVFRRRAGCFVQRVLPSRCCWRLRFCAGWCGIGCGR